MTSDLMKQAVVFVLLVLAQTLVLGRIHLFDCATPLLYVYFIIRLPRNYPKWALLLWGFLLGLSIDILGNTPGLASTSLTFLAIVQPYYMELFVPRDSAENLRPSMDTIGPLKYAYYAVGLVLLYCLVFYSLEMFNFFNALQWLLCVVGSTLLTTLLVYTFEIAGKK
ncbi:MAG: rod shape-determining protein MreD [Prevotella sp.]|nr:rod shape-determining protein MreD [Prevotella sp.]MBR1504947.1 rod shape-determining protein MreD [Prevotella sp.]